MPLKTENPLRRALPWLIAAGGVAVSALIAWNIVSLRQEHIREEVGFESLRMARLVEMKLQDSVSALLRMSDRWNAAGGARLQLWKRDAGNYIRDNAAYRSIALLDDGFTVYAAAGSAPPAAPAAARDMLRRAQREKAPFVFEAPAPSAATASMSFYFPLYRPDGGTDGFLAAAYDMGGDLSPVAADSRIEILDRDRVIFSTPWNAAEHPRTVTRETNVSFSGVTWSVRVTGDASGGGNGGLTLAVFLACAGLSLALAAVLHAADKAGRSDRRYALATGMAHVALWEWDVEKETVVWGGNAWEIFRVGKNEDIPTTFAETMRGVHEKDRERILAEVAQSLASGPAFVVDYRMPLPDGHEIWVQSRGNVLQRKDGKPARLAGTLVDITDRRKIEAEADSTRRHLETIFDTIVDGLITIDEKGAILSYNNACERIFGYAENEVSGRNISMLMPPAYAGAHDGYLSSYLRTGKAKIIGIGREVEGRRKDGTVFPLDLSIAEVKTGGPNRIFSGVVRDITERRNYENGLKRSNEELEKFAYVASHDLKTPLRNIDDLARWVVEDTAGILPADAADKLALLRERIGDLEQLLDDILAYSRAGRIVDAPVEIDAQELAERLISTHVPAGFTASIKGRLPVIVSPRTPLEQVLGNLISNAVKHHGTKSGNIEIEAREDGNFHEFIVRDDGPGIPPEFHKRAFEMFQTLQPRDTTPGSGLGLSIVKKLVEWQDGRCWIVSDGKGSGTEIHFTWPRNAPRVA